jgi:hypothetical protein
VLLHEDCNGGQKGQQLMLVGLGKPQTTATWGEDAFHVGINPRHSQSQLVACCAVSH